jgi:hypothetical protein
MFLLLVLIPEGLVRQEGLGKLKEIISSDLEQATFLLLAECLIAQPRTHVNN